MIRFINLTSRILIDDEEPHFAWYDTILSNFMSFSGCQAWHTWSDFLDDLNTYLDKTRSSLADDKWHEERKEEITSRFAGLFQFRKSPKANPSDPSHPDEGT